MTDQAWPELPYAEWKDTYTTLHMWTQIVGKIRLAQTPWLNHSWHVVLCVSPRGLTTSSIPYNGRSFELEFDFLDHVLLASTEKGRSSKSSFFPVRWQISIPMSCGCWLNWAFGFAFVRCRTLYRSRSVQRRSHPRLLRPRLRRAPLAPAHQGRAGAVRVPHRLHRQMQPGSLLLGSFDLAVTRFSGRRAPLHPGGVPHLPDAVAQEAYSHEVSSAGFWPGNAIIPYPAFYSYAYPEPPGFAQAAIRPAEAFYSKDLSEYILPYETVRTAADPKRALMDFLVSTYEAAASLAKWIVPRWTAPRASRASPVRSMLVAARHRSPLPCGRGLCRPGAQKRDAWREG